MTIRSCLVIALAITGCGRRPGADNGNDLPDASDCEGLRCSVDTSCDATHKTTITGTAFAPNGTLPLYNAIVYVPTGEVLPFPSGVTCDRCDGKVSGTPLAQAVTGPDGTFTLTDVPSGVDIPLVIQLGRWRRQVTIPAVTSCEVTTIGPDLTRLPRNAREGDIPQIAIASGAADPFECLLLKAGIDANEIGESNGAAPTRIHFYRATDKPGTDLATYAPRADALYTSLANLLRYDVVLLPCEGGAFDKSRVAGNTLASDPRALLEQYVNVGGRVFATHLSYAWFTYQGSPFNRIAAPTSATGQWPVGQVDQYDSTIPGKIALTFQKGADFAQWLRAAGATSQPNRLEIKEGRHDLTGVDPRLATSWVTHDFSPVGGGPGVMHVTFNTPLDAPPLGGSGERAYCGRVVFSDFHVTAGALNNGSLPFPAACKAGELTDQEKALIFMLFDLSSCVQDELL